MKYYNFIWIEPFIKSEHGFRRGLRARVQPKQVQEEEQIRELVQERVQGPVLQQA